MFRPPTCISCDMTYTFSVASRPQPRIKLDGSDDEVDVEGSATGTLGSVQEDHEEASDLSVGGSTCRRLVDKSEIPPLAI